jgi:5-hydroxyisourate hydrolase-like protein (transthyretin family)
MKSLPLIAVVLLTFTIFTAMASTITQPNIPLILLLSSDTIYSTDYLIISGQVLPNESIIIQVQHSNQSTTQTLEAVSDRDGHFKVDLLNSEPLTPGIYTVKATTRSSTARNAFTVVDESTRLCSELKQTVKRTRSEADAVYKILTPFTTLATEMNASIQEGNSLYEKAQNQQELGEMTNSLEAYRAALQAYGEALHTSELMSSSKQPSQEATLIMELLEKIRRLNDTVTDLNNQTSQAPNSLDAAKDLITMAEKQLSEARARSAARPQR